MAKQGDMDKFWDDMMSETVKRAVMYGDWRTLYGTPVTNTIPNSTQSNQADSTLSVAGLLKAIEMFEERSKSKETTIYDIAQQLKSNEKITIISDEYQNVIITISNPLEYKAIGLTKECWLDDSRKHLSKQLNDLLSSLRRINADK